MLSSVAEYGPLVPFFGEYTIEVENGTIDEIHVNEIDKTYLQVIRLHGSQPISVYANSEE